MKKIFSLFVATIAITMSALAQTVYFVDGFENGFDAQWSQLYFDAAANEGHGAWVSEAPSFSQAWKTEVDGLQGASLKYPDGAVVGKGRAYFRQEAAPGQNVQTAGYRTRLVTPKMDLSSGYQPILRFYHAQAKWTADFDTLRVYYRQGEGTQWALLKEFTSVIQKWTFEEIDLPLVGEDYQIAFEADENMGRGIVLDSVIIRTKPQITIPHDLAYNDMRDNGVNVTWEASKDADYFRVVVSTMDLDLNVTPLYIDSTQYIVMDSVRDSDLPQSIRLEKLEPGATYYVQVQSLGEFENSAWSNTFSFRMKPVEYIPYFEDFNIKYVDNTTKNQQLKTWTWGGDIEPIIPLWIGEACFGYYSPDATPAVAFIGAHISSSGEFSGATTFIPAGKTAYIVSPELVDSTNPNFKLNECHVTFWGTVRHATDDHKRSIIVGIANDPEDPTTFVPVDTCYIWGYETFEFFDIDLAKYQGNGKYLFFANNFDKTNQFYIDKVNIEKRPAVGMVKMQSIHCIPDTASLALSWDAVAGVSQYYVKYAKLDSKGSAVPLFASEMVNPQAAQSTTPSVTLQGLTPRSKYVVSVQAANGEWSQPKAYYTSAKMELPKTFGFEENEGTYNIGGIVAKAYPLDWIVYSNDPDIPYCYSNVSYSHTGTNSLYLVKNVGNDAWAVMPKVEAVKDVEVIFYDKTYNASYVDSKLQVGVMTDPTDLSTFVKVSEVMATELSQRFYVNFMEYTGDGQYIAFRWMENAKEGVKCAHAIDDVTVRPLGTCLPISALNVSDITDNSAVLSWSKGEGHKWRVIVHKSAIKDENLATAKGDVVDSIMTSDTLVLNNLLWSNTYYVYVQTDCETEKSEWTATSFKTECPVQLSVPYVENFDRFATGSGKYPECWTPAFNSTTTSYPYISTTSSNSLPNSLYFYASSTTGSFISLPEMNKPISSLKVSFSAYYSTIGYKLYVGVMTDPNDPDTFEKIDSITTTSSWEEYSISLSKYSGNGKYIAFSNFTGTGYSYLYIDDVTVTDMTDEAPVGYRALEATTESLTVGWDGITTGQWEVIVSKKEYAITDSFCVDSVKAEDRLAYDSVEVNSYTVNGLSALTTYYFYVKSTNGKNWSKAALTTSCTTWNPRIKYTEGFESYGPTVTYTLSTTAGYQISPAWWEKALTPTCWTVGNQKLGTDPSVCTSATRGYFPFIFSNGSVTVNATTKVVTTTNYYDKGTANSTGKYAPAGCNALKMNTSTTYGIVWAAMPELECSDEDMSSLVITAQAKFTVATASIPHSLIVGIMDDPTDLSTFVVLDSIATGAGIAYSSASQNIEVAVGEKGYTGKGRYVAFRTAYNPNATASSAYKVCGTTVYLDNVCISMASCPAPKPSMSQVTDSSAVLNAGLKVDNGWKYIVTSQKYNTDSLDSKVMPADSIIVAQGTRPEESKQALITGLLADTTYYVYVTTLCDAGETSVWRETSFKTLCPDVDITSFFEGFEDYETTAGSKVGCWTVGNVAAPTNTSSIPYAVSSTLTGSKKVLNIYSTKATANNAYAITPGLAFESGKSLKDYQLRCQVLASTSTSSIASTTTTEFRLLMGVVTDPSDMSTLTVLDTVLFEKGVNTFIYPFDQYEGTGKYVVFMAYSAELTYARIYLDDVEFEPIPTCQIATKLEVTEVGEDTLALAWQGKAANYLVALSTELYVDSVKADSIATSKNVIKAEVSGNSYVFKGIKANTKYYAYVQGLCSATEKSEWSYDVCQARTECPTNGVELPFNDGFEEYTTGNIYCYNGVYTNASAPTAYPAINTTATNVHGGAKALYLYSTATLVSAIVTPEINVADMKTLQISFWYKAYAKDKHLYIGTVSNRDSILQTFDTLAVINTTATTYQQYFINLDTITKPINTKNIAFLVEQIASGYGYIDDLKIRYIPSCYAPTNIAISNVGLEGATLSFNKADSTDTNWQVRLTNETTKKNEIISITDTIYELSVVKSTAYTVEVRTDCGEDQSEWSDPIRFNTKSTIDIYTYSFEKNEQGTTSVRSPKSTSDSYFIHPALTSESGSKSTYTYFPYSLVNTTTYSYSLDPTNDITAAALKFQTTATYDSATVILPVIENPKGKQLSFFVRAGYAYTSNYSTASNRNVVSTVYPNAILSVGVVDSMKNYQTFQEIQAYKPSVMVAKDTLTKKSYYGWDKVVLPLDDINLTGKQIALMMKGCGAATLYVDSLAIETTEGYATPTFTQVQAFDTRVKLEWTNAGANSYNIYVIDTTKSAKKYDFIPYLQEADAACITKITGITGTSYMVSDLGQSSTYEFYVENADQEGKRGALSNRRMATTSCSAVAGNGFSYDFEPGPNYKMGKNPKESTADGFTFQWPTSTTASDTLYKTPECWQVGLQGYDITSTTYKSYVPTLRSNTMTAGTTAQFIYAKNGYSCMQFYSLTSYKDAAYAVMSPIELNMDTAELEFYGRCTYAKVSDGKISNVTYLKGTSYSTKLAVGTVSDPYDITTFVALDTIEYDYTAGILSTTMTESSDQTGNKYWQRFIVPLKGAAGQYIAFKQVGYGYFYMDDLSIRKHQTARSPRQLNEDSVGAKTAKVSWIGMEDGGVYTLQYVSSPAGEAVDWTKASTVDSIQDNEYTITGLSVNSEYVWRVAQKTANLNQSDYAIYRYFRTDCESLNPNGYKTGFECQTENDPYVILFTLSSTNYRKNECWDYRNAGTTQTYSTSWAYNIPNTTSASYAHSGAYGLKLYATGTTYQTAAVTPFINAEIGQAGVGFDTLQVSFWACPSPHGISGTYKDQISTASGATTAKTVEVGTCTDPLDTATYTVLQVCTYEVEGNNLAAKAQANADNDYAFQKFTVKLNKATGPYVFIRASKTMADGTVKSSSTMYIDDLVFEKLQSCDPAFSLKANDITINDAQLSWEANGSKSFDVIVSTEPTFADTVFYQENITASSVKVTGLEANKQYFFRVLNYCDDAREEVASWSQNAYFYTPKAPMFDEKFTMDDIKTESKGWTSCRAWAKDVFAGKALRDTTLSGVYNSWYRVQNNAMSGYALRSYLYYSTTSTTADTYLQFNWLVTPAITIERDSAMLSFDAALTYYSTTTGESIYKDAKWNTGYDDQFMVIVSEDAGKTWKRENATIWNNETSTDPNDSLYVWGKGDYVLTAISNVPEKKFVDLSKYAGKTIKIAFYAENSVNNAMNAIHIDNVHVNYTVQQAQDMTLCQYEDVDNVFGFSINGDTVSSGLCKKERYTLATEQGELDSTFVLNANYLEAPVYEYEITVCKGQPFSYLGFNEHSAPGTYRMKLISQVTGCDSIVNFTIKHTEAFASESDTTICEGNWFNWYGQIIDKPGTYVDTLQACESYGGCDSVVTLHVEVITLKRSKTEITLCQGGSYEFGGKIYDQSGVYYDTIATAGCDSIAELNLTIRKNAHTTFVDSIYHGESYTWGDRIFYESTTSDSTFTDAFGCDSIVTLNLLVKYQDVIYTYAYICQGGSYEFGGKVYTEAGTYYDTIPRPGLADSIAGLYLDVKIPNVVNTNASICEGSEYLFGDTTLTTAGSYTKVFENRFGCDSVVNLLLAIIPTERTQYAASICKGEEYEFFGKQLTESGTYVDTTQTIQGCDSIVTLYLTVKEPMNDTLPANICAGSSYTFYGKEYNKSGIYSVEVEDGGNGCPATKYLNLTVNDTLKGSVYAEFCSEYIYQGQTYTQSGTYIVLIKTEGGCDSIVTLTLLQTQDVHITIDTTLCKGEEYVDEYFQVTVPGTYENTRVLPGGCTEYRTLILKNDPDILVVDTTIDLYELPYSYRGGEIYYDVNTQTGVYNDTLNVASARGCDQTLYHTLHVIDVTGFEDLYNTKEQPRKMIIDNKLYIILDDTWYDATGKKITPMK